ncbi:MAG TPA: carboxypeptidase-like regulatory domain-containing protein [Chryseolinea sp.]
MQLTLCIQVRVIPTVALGILSFVFAHAQSRLISGKVFDGRSKSPLQFASVSVLGKSIGTVTNANGEFDFHIPETYHHDSLLISHVGYKSFRDKIDVLPRGDLSIGLQAMPVLLREITIHEKNLTGKEIVAKAVNNLNLNYSTKPFCLEGFFRAIEAENGKYTILTEAAVDIYDKNFDGKPKRQLQESVYVKEMRRSLSQGNRRRSNIGITLADLLENNDVRYNRGMLDTANTFSLDTVTFYKDRPVYGVSMGRGTDTGMLYIDMETFGFLKIDMERRSRDDAQYYYVEDRLNKSESRRRIWFRFSVEFGQYNEKLYPRRMHESELNEFIDNTAQLKVSSVETLELIVTNIIPGKENPAAKKMKYGLVLKEGEYHAEFWKTYNVLKLTPLDEKLIRDLEREISLQKQFEKQK